MSYYHRDENDHIRDKYNNYKDAAEVAKAVADGILKYYDAERKVYNPETGEEFWPDGTMRQ